MNAVYISGNLGRDAELKYTPGGKAVCQASVFAKDKWTDNAGQKQESDTPVTIEAWEGWAGCLARYKKGMEIAIEGRLKLDEWEDRETGKKRSKLFVVVKAIVGGPIPRDPNRQGNQDGGYGPADEDGPPPRDEAQAAPAQQRRPPPQQRPAPATRPPGQAQQGPFSDSL